MHTVITKTIKKLEHSLTVADKSFEDSCSPTYYYEIVNSLSDQIDVIRRAITILERYQRAATHAGQKVWWNKYCTLCDEYSYLPKL